MSPNGCPPDGDAHPHRHPRRRVSFKEVRLLLFAIIGALPLLALLPSATLQSRLALHEAHALFAQAQQEKAIAQYEKVLKLDPRQAYAWFFLARSHEPVERDSFVDLPGSDPEAAAKAEAARQAAEDRRRTRALEAYQQAIDLGLGKVDTFDYQAEALAALVSLQHTTPGQKQAALVTAKRLAHEYPADPRALGVLARTHERLDNLAEAEATFRKLRGMMPSDPRACEALASFYYRPRDGRSRFDEAMAVLEECAALTPTEPAGYQKVAAFYLDKAYRDHSLADEPRGQLADKGLTAANKALTLDPTHFESMFYKALLLRLKASTTADPVKRRELLEEAMTLQRAALDERRRKLEEQALQGAQP